MRDIKKNGQTHKNIVGPVVLGVAGAAAIGATAFALSNKKVRKQIGRVWEGAVDQGKEAFGSLQDKVYMQAQQLGKRAKKAIKEEKAKTGRKLALHEAR